MAVTIDSLRDYEFWLKNDPQTILDLAASQGGWAKVFPDKNDFPEWASRVRNYFNIYPVSLRLLENYDKLAHERRIVLSRLRQSGISPQGGWGFLAWSGDIYVDMRGRPWFLYSKGGSIYHYKAPGDSDKTKAVRATARSRRATPVFKLVCPDKAGGSSEVVVHNWKGRITRDSTIRGMNPGGRAKSISSRVVVKPEYKGSYNYTCVIFGSKSGHDFRDVEPDKVASDPLFLIDPENRGDLVNRRFPQRHKGKDLAESS